MDEEIGFTFSSVKTTETGTTTFEMVKWIPVDAPWTEVAGLFMQFMKHQYGVDVDVHLSVPVIPLTVGSTTTTANVPGTWSFTNPIDIKMST